MKTFLVDDIITRLKSGLNVKTDKELAERLGVTNPTISNWRTRNTIDWNRIFSICEQLSFDWLIKGENDTYPLAEIIDNKNGIPYYDEMFECGFDELIAPSSERPDYYINVPGYEKATLWCNASGDSMFPEIKNGDLIALQEIQDPTFLPYGDIYAFVTTNGMRTIKRLGRSEEKGCYRLIPTNKEYDEQNLPLRLIQKAYRVLGAIKSF